MVPRRYGIPLFIGLVATALALGGALAHLYELANKMSLGRDDYFTVQQIYQGWNRLGFVLLVEAAALLALAIIARGDRPMLRPVLLAIFGLVGAQIVFWSYTFPANQATQNWTLIPANWEVLRAQWEYSHAAGAGFQLLTFCALGYAAIFARHRA